MHPDFQSKHTAFPEKRIELPNTLLQRKNRMEIAKTLGTVVITYTVHYASTKIYSHVCVPDGVWGYIQGFLMLGSPMCTAMLNFASSTQSSYGTIITMVLSRLLIDATAYSAIERPKASTGPD
jgi:hypothetical protein